MLLPASNRALSCVKRTLIRTQSLFSPSTRGWGEGDSILAKVGKAKVCVKIERRENEREEEEREKEK